MMRAALRDWVSASPPGRPGAIVRAFEAAAREAAAR